MKVAIINYGTGNYLSLVNFLSKFSNLDITITLKKKDIINSDILIFPGVGTFGEALRNLKKKKLFFVLKQEIKKGKPVLGICLGMQILFKFSDENKEAIGLSLMKGSAKKLIKTNTGWERIKTLSNKFNKFDNLHFYFNHSFYQNCEKQYMFASIKKYKKNIPVIIMKKNIFGVQFHPENSQGNGKFFIEFILKKFLKKN